MNYEEFKKELTQTVRESIAEKGVEAKVETNFVEKVNTTYEALSIIPEESNLGINLNIESFFAAFENGESLETIVKNVVDLTEKHLEAAPEVDLKMLNDYERMKEKLCMEVVSYERNKDLMSKVPHKRMEDLAVVYRFIMGNEGGYHSSILVTNRLIEKYGITLDQLHADALEIAPELRPAVIRGIGEVLSDMMGEDMLELLQEGAGDAEGKMYVATVKEGSGGAGILAYQEFMDQAAARLGGDFYILPSSIHELILLKDDNNMDLRSLEAMVAEVNATQVSPEERLSDNVYHYDSKDHIFELAEKYEARKQEKEIKEKPKEKESVLKDLKEKKQEISEKPVKKEPEKTAKMKGGEAL